MSAASSADVGLDGAIRFAIAPYGLDSLYPIDYMMIFMIEVRQTAEFSAWLRRLKDAKAKARIAARVERMKFGNLGDYKSLGGALMEIRVDFGPGYRVYFVRQGAAIVLLLCGGDKRTQQRDIRRAYELAEKL